MSAPPAAPLMRAVSQDVLGGPGGAVVNLGAGLPTLVSSYVGNRPVILHAENGTLNYAPSSRETEFGPDVHDASGYFVELRPGAAVFDSVRQ